MVEKKKKPFNLNTKITSAIRKIWRTCPVRLEAIKLARDPNKPKTCRGEYYLICAWCKDSVNEKLMSVDHKVPVVAADSSVDKDWNEVVKKTFYPDGGVDGLQILCSPCHDEKTKAEKQERSAYKKSLKPPKVLKVRKTRVPRMKKVSEGCG